MRAKAIRKSALVPENLIDFIIEYLPNLLRKIIDLQMTIFKTIIHYLKIDEALKFYPYQKYRYPGGPKSAA
jgi:hypothetical protein